MTQTERIEQMEHFLDEAAMAARGLSAALDRYAAAQEAVKALDAYYGSDEWKADLLADEQGRLPAGLKRGVLSEDAAWNVLDECRELNIRMLETVTEILKTT